ncbi:membrane fusion-like protein [Shewanella sp. 6_MG-2023]|uniref:membrane fusion-like protein n=1 Tax=Shewanella sp. 6_MG-2023 TaxID=3062660 RepID=UPI0026E21169|nr:membrane fusion-like protein [Shewanella sp. 6_MG-2023]MDO6619229.1 membrane fusion-like protein [Shewanella sp. 6_MG-2023]
MMAKFGVSLVCIPLCLSASFVCAKTISLAELGSLELKYTQPQKGVSYEGSSLPAQIERLPGNDYWVRTPENIQQVTYLVAQGQAVTKGQAIVRLTGPEIFHFLAQIEATKSLFDLSKQRYERNKSLLKTNSISIDKWREISQDYLSTQLKYQHMQHFMELVESIDTSTESLVIRAPIAGIVNLTNLSSSYNAGAALFSLIPADSIRIKINVPMNQSTSLSAVNINQCHVSIDEVSAIADGVFLTAWSMPVPLGCNLLLGQQITVIPEYQKAVYLLPKTSVFSWQQETQIFAKTASILSALTIEVLGSTSNEYIVASDQDLSNIYVLTQSVAAVKGILLGLGGE